MTRDYDPKSMALRGKIGAHRLHSRHDPQEITAPMRQAAWERFLTEVDPDKVLPEEERLRRAKQAQKAHLARIQFLAAESRRKKRQRTAASSP